MDTEGEKYIRAVIKNFLNDNRHGGIKKLMEASGLSRPTVSRFANGGSVEPETLKALDEAIEKLDFSASVEEITNPNDALSDSIAILKDTVFLVQDPAKSRGKKSRLLLKLLEIIETEFASELREIGRLD